MSNLDTWQYGVFRRYPASKQQLIVLKKPFSPAFPGGLIKPVTMIAENAGSRNAAPSRWPFGRDLADERPPMARFGLISFHPDTS